MNPKDLLQVRDARQYEDFILDAWQTRREYLNEYHSRLQKLDAFLRGDWSVEFPDGRMVRDTPKIEDRVLTKIEDTGYLAGSVLPTIRVEPINERDFTNAERRERVLQFYWQNSELSNVLPRLFMDLLGTGLAVLSIWPDFAVRDKMERFPLFKRIDPRHVLPPLDYVLDGSVAPRDLIVHKVVKTRNLMHDYPDAVAELQRKAAQLAQSMKGKGGKVPAIDTSQVVRIDYYGCDRIISIACVDGYESLVVTLENTENSLGCCPIVLGIRPTADGRIRGKVDSMMPVLTAENRLMTYVLDYADQMVFAPLAKKGDVVNAEDFGPNAIIDLGTDGEVSRIAPAAANPQLFHIISDLERHSRRAGNLPEARAGNVDQSIGSAAFVESLMGGLTTEVQTLQKVMEVMLRQANVIAQKVDSTYCDAKKAIAGLAKGGSFRETYVPSELLKDTYNFVSYGAGAGLDKFNAEIRMAQREARGYVSKRWVRENLEGVENITQEENRIIDEASLMAMLQHALTLASQGDPSALQVIQRARKMNKNPLELVGQLTAAPALQPQQPQMQLPQGPPGTPEQSVRSMQKGGIPGVGEKSPPAAMPSLQMMMGR